MQNAVLRDVWEMQVRGEGNFRRGAGPGSGYRTLRKSE